MFSIAVSVFAAEGEAAVDLYGRTNFTRTSSFFWDDQEGWY